MCGKNPVPETQVLSLTSKSYLLPEAAENHSASKGVLLGTPMNMTECEGLRFSCSVWTERGEGTRLSKAKRYEEENSKNLSPPWVIREATLNHIIERCLVSPVVQSYVTVAPGGCRFDLNS